MLGIKGGISPKAHGKRPSLRLLRGRTWDRSEGPITRATSQHMVVPSSSLPPPSAYMHEGATLQYDVVGFVDVEGRWYKS